MTTQVGADRQPALERVSRRLREHPFLVDAALAVLLFFLVVTSGLGSDDSTSVVLVLSLALIAPLAWRRRATVPAAIAVTVAGLVELVVLSQFLLANVAAPAMVYALAAYAPAVWRRAGLVVGLVGALLAADRYFGNVYLGVGSGYASLQGTVISAAAIAVLVLACWAMGSVKRGRLLREQGLRERAELLEVERDQEMALAASAERARIAREMHDVVAHSLSVVIAQADGGRYAGRTDPGAAIGALEQIAATGRTALTDMRSLLGVLREDGAQEFAPQPDVAAITDLVADVQRSGLDVDLISEGTPVELAAGTQLAAYRITQESLTNVLKHAGPASRAWVRLHWREDALELSVLDDGRGAAAVRETGDGGGHGVLGMRERAALHGGRVDAGPRHGGGFGVHAVLPYRQRR